MTVSTDSQRVFIWAALAAVLFLNYMAWQRDYPPARAPSAETAAQAPASHDVLPQLPADGNKPATPNVAAPPPAASSHATEPSAPKIRVVTDVLDLDIST